MSQRADSACSSFVEMNAVENTDGKKWKTRQIEFCGAGQTSRAKYVRIAHDDDAEDVLKSVFEKQWKLELPKLLISVTGGAKSFHLNPKLKQVLRQGLLKAARTTGAWIITGGTNTGVMKHVGEAVRGQTVTSNPLENDFNQLHLIGIATWGIIANKETLVDNKDTVTYQMTSSMESAEACLDNNHTHFILVDNGTDYGGEISFRTSLENAISKRDISSAESIHGIPVVLLVLEGGLNTIKTVLKSVTSRPAVPVVIAEGSGRAADILAFAHRIITENKGPDTTEQDPVEHPQLKDKIKLAFPKENNSKLLEVYNDVLNCVNNKEFITIFRVNEEGVDIDKAILKAFLRAKCASVADQLRLALMWNRADIAKSEIFTQSNGWTIEELEVFMMNALEKNRVEFVRLLLENGVGMGRFLNEERLLKLYQARSEFSVTFKKVIGKNKLENFKLQDIDSIIKKMLGGTRQGSETRKVNPVDIIEEKFQHPFNDLFCWAVICNMQKMALLMWELGDNNIARALVGAKLYMEIARKLEGDGVYEQIMANQKEFKDVALSLFDECSQVNERATRKLLTYHLSDWCGHTCLSLAVMTNHEKFVAHASCQSLLTDIWMGAMRNINFPSLRTILGIIVPPTIYFLDFKNKEELSLLPVTFYKHQRREKKKKRNRGEEEEEGIEENKGPEERYERSVFSTMSEFYRAPITKFWANVIAYMMFLMLFTYVIIVKGSYSLIEIFVIVFVCSFCTEEIRQICQSDNSTSDSRLYVWASSKWNICDGLAVVFFFLGLGLRVGLGPRFNPPLGLRFKPPTACIGHLVYSLDIMLWIIRLLDFFSVSKHLGPYVVMIGRMTVDMLYFLLIMVVFLLAYGVAQQAILFPYEQGSWGLISKIFLRPYFQTYGELFITDPTQLSNSSTTEFGIPKYDSYRGTIAIIIMAFYLLVANILLLNLLIAIFNNTFSEVQANSNQIWKFRRYDLIMEYAQRPVLVPPLIILNHVIELLCYSWHCCCRGNSLHLKQPQDNRLKLFLNNQELQKLLIFEEHCLYLYFHHKDTLFNATSKERVRVIGSRVEYITNQLEDLTKETINQDKTVTALTENVKTLETTTKTILEQLTLLQGLNPKRFGIIDSDDEDALSTKDALRRLKTPKDA